MTKCNPWYGYETCFTKCDHYFFPTVFDLYCIYFLRLLLRPVVAVMITIQQEMFSEFQHNWTYGCLNSNPPWRHQLLAFRPPSTLVNKYLTYRNQGITLIFVIFRQWEIIWSKLLVIFNGGQRSILIVQIECTIVF